LAIEFYFKNKILRRGVFKPLSLNLIKSEESSKEIKISSNFQKREKNSKIQEPYLWTTIEHFLAL